MAAQSYIADPSQQIRACADVRKAMRDWDSGRFVCSEMVTHLVCIGVLGEDRKEFTAFGAAEFRHIQENFSRKPRDRCTRRGDGYCSHEFACND